MSSTSSIQVNGWAGRVLAGVMIVLLAAGVVGVWNMNAALSGISHDMDWLKDQVKENTSRLNNRHD